MATDTDVVAWIDEQRRAGRAWCIRTAVSRAVDEARVANTTSVRLDGTVFLATGAPLTGGRWRIIEASGARVVPQYGFIPGGLLGVGCARPNAADDMYVMTRVLTPDCRILPSEGPNVIQVSSVGPSATKADYSNYGFPNVGIAAPGGWFRDFIGTPAYRTSANLILSTYPMHVAIQEGLVDADGNPLSDAVVKACGKNGKKCGIYTYLQGTSMAAPHVTGVMALIVDRFGHAAPGGQQLDTDIVRDILLSTATDHDCPAGGVEDYTDEGRPAEFNAVCEGTPANNGLYGEGIVNALAAVQ